MDGPQKKSSHDLPWAPDPPAGHATLVQRVFAWQNKDTVFYVVSIGLHVAVAFILAGSWKNSTARTAQQTPPAPQAAPPAPVARLEIDVAPVRYTDMDIRRLLPGAQASPPNRPKQPSGSPAAPAPLRPAPSDDPAPESTPTIELNPAADKNPAGRRSGTVDVTAPRLGFAFIDATAPAPSRADDQMGIDLTDGSAADDSSLPMSISERIGLQQTQTKDARHGVRR